MTAHALRVCALVVVLLLQGRFSAADPRHVRIETENGPIHVWQPENYDVATAGIVVYVHGYFANVDAAWKRYRLARQFSESGLNAMFIACEAPKGPRERVYWTGVQPLLDAVVAGTGDELPKGPVVVVGHSGAHRTLRMWIESNDIDTIVLLDALYGEIDDFRVWVSSDESRRLIDAAALTRRWTDELHADLPDTLYFKRFPPASVGKLRGARQARVVYVRSQHDHMALVTGGIALPMLLRAVDLPLVENASRKSPIRAL